LCWRHVRIQLCKTRPKFNLHKRITFTKMRFEVQVNLGPSLPILEKSFVLRTSEGSY
jgi:hypothetical protein